ncbi:RTA1 like protein-domain-containing protein [Mucidula mucida]|nr:RTA1 like protein-domain-containing protein [Mucidula mucida]
MDFSHHPEIRDVVLQADSKLSYVPGIAANASTAALYALLAIGHLVWALRTKQTRWGFLLPFAEIHATAGFALRIILRNNQRSSMLIIAAELLVIMPAAGFMAFNYLVYGKLIATVDTAMDSNEGLFRRSRYTLVPSTLAVKALLATAVVAVLIQTGAGGLLSSDKQNMKNLGNTLLLVSVIEQAVSYGIFILIVISSLVLVLRRCSAFSWSYKNPLMMVFVLMLGSSLNVMIRTAFRIIQYSGGRNGKLSTTEYYIIAFDAVVLAAANAHWLAYWPIERLDRLRLPGSVPPSSSFQLGAVKSTSEQSSNPSRY